MKLSSHIKKQLRIWEFIPWLKRQQGTTIANHIYLKPDIYEDLLSQKPKSENIAILIHEEAHIKRIKELGFIKFGILYLLSRKFRFHEELIANKASFTYLKKMKKKVDLKRKAEILSSWLYLWPVSYNFALKEVKKAWEEV